MSCLLVPFGGLRDIRLEPAETVVVCPVTGGFGGAGVQVAIAMGRNEQELSRLKAHLTKGTPGDSIETVKITGDEEKDAVALQAFGTIDAILDLSPPAASKSTHLNSAILALRSKGRISLMGGFADGPIPSFQLIAKSTTIKGKFMYEKEDMELFVRMLERGLFPRGTDFVDLKTFSLEERKIALDVAAEFTGIRRFVAIIP